MSEHNHSSLASERHTLSSVSRDERDDAALLKAIADHKEQRALSELFSRYRKPVYNLAFRLTRQNETALDILQETMLAVWQTAGNYRETGRARGWLLKIVALKSMRALRDQGRIRKRLENKKAILQQSGVSPTPDSLERNETLASLREAMDSLTPSDQKLLALRFGGGLNWVQMEAALDLPSRTLRYRVNCCLEKLRAVLGKEGSPSCGVLLAATQIQEALCSGGILPEDLEGWFATKVADISQSPAPLNHSWISLKKGVVCLLLLAGTSGAVIAGLMVMPSNPKATSQPVSDALTKASSRNSQSLSFINKFWIFKKPPPSDLEVVAGEWNWLAPKKNSLGAMVAGPGSGVAVRPLLHIPASPLRVVMATRPDQSKVLEATNNRLSYSVGAMWQSSFKLPTKVWRNRKVFPNISGDKLNAEGMKKTFEFTTYFFDRYQITLFQQGTVFSIVEYEQPYPGEWIVILLKSMVLERLEINTIKPSQIPEAIRKPLLLVDTLMSTGELTLDSKKRLPPPKKYSP